MPTIFKRRQSPHWQIRYLDRSGRIKSLSARVRDRREAERRGRSLEERELKIREGRITAGEAEAQTASTIPVKDHLRDHLEAEARRGLHPRHVCTKRAMLERFFRLEGIKYLGQIDSGVLRRHMRRLVDAGVDPSGDGRVKDPIARAGVPRRLSARTANAARSIVKRFLQWCVEERRLTVHPCPGKSVASQNEDLDRRRRRRPLTEEELRALLRHVEGTGREHAYLIAVLTGLRRSELASLQWRDVHLGDQPHLALRAATTKSKQTEEVPLNREAIEAIAELQSKRHEGADSRDLVIGRVPSPSELYRDLEGAGVQARLGRSAVPDDAGEVIDFHSLRATFATMLARAGVLPLHLRRLMRHASIETTDKHYTGLRLSDLGREVDRLGHVGVRTPVRTCPAPKHASRGASVREGRRGREERIDSEAAVLAGLGVTRRDHAGKRETGLEPATFSLEG